MIHQVIWPSPGTAVPSFSLSIHTLKVGLSRISSQVPVSVSDVTFVTFFGVKKCDALNVSYFWEECENLAHENIFFNL